MIATVLIKAVVISAAASAVSQSEYTMADAEREVAAFFFQRPDCALVENQMADILESSNLSLPEACDTARAQLGRKVP